MKFAGTAMITHDSAQEFCTEVNKVLHDIEKKGLISEVHYQYVASNGGVMHSALIICRKEESDDNAARIKRLEDEKAALLADLQKCFSINAADGLVDECYFCAHRFQPTEAQLEPCKFAKSSFGGVCGGWQWCGVKEDNNEKQ